jgi:hypothetical protein
MVDGSFGAREVRAKNRAVSNLGAVGHMVNYPIFIP